LRTELKTDVVAYVSSNPDLSRYTGEEIEKLISVMMEFGVTVNELQDLIETGDILEPLDPLPLTTPNGVTLSGAEQQRRLSMLEKVALENGVILDDVSDDDLVNLISADEAVMKFVGEGEGEEREIRVRFNEAVTENNANKDVEEDVERPVKKKEL